MNIRLEGYSFGAAEIRRGNRKNCCIAIDKQSNVLFTWVHVSLRASDFKWRMDHALWHTNQGSFSVFQQEEDAPMAPVMAARGTSASAGGDSSGGAAGYPFDERTAPPDSPPSRAPVAEAAMCLFLPTPTLSCPRTPTRLRIIWSSSAIDELHARVRTAPLKFVAWFGSFARAPFWL